MLISAALKRFPEDFIVEELPLYEPSGQGDHVYVTFEKRGKNTLDAVREIARALGCNPRDAGTAGMKDRHAVTTQTISLLPAKGQKPDELCERARELSIEGIRVVSAARHGNKLKTGHLAGNRFTIVLRDIDAASIGDACARMRALGEQGVPNAFGEQRFGRDHDNAARAKAWLSGKVPPPRDARVLRLLYSALQSEVFNAVLDKRVADGTWRTPMLGDVLKKTDSGGLFLCTDPEADGARARAGEVVPTGPIFGPKMLQPEATMAELEDAITRELLGDELDLGRARGLGDGTRRALVLPVRDIVADEILPETGEERRSCRVGFVLPKGAYATTVLSQVFSWGPGATAGAEDASDVEENH